MDRETQNGGTGGIMKVKICLMTAAAATLFFVYGFSVEFVSFSFLMVVLIAAAYEDIRTMMIPNRYIGIGLTGAAAVMILNIFKPLPVYDEKYWWYPLMGVFTGSGVCLLFSWVMSFISKGRYVTGEGDIKLLIPVGIFLGWHNTWYALAAAVIFAAITALGLIATGKRAWHDNLPFAPFIATGCLFVLIVTK